MELLGVSVRVDGGQAVVALRGELDVSSVQQLGRALDEARIRAGADDPIVLDLRNLSFIDCTGLGAILRARATLGDRLSLRSGRSVERLVALTGMADELAFIAGTGQSSRSDAEANVAYVRHLCEAFSRGGMTALAPLVPDDVSWRPLAAGGRVLRGSAQLSELWAGGGHAALFPAAVTAIGSNVVVRFIITVAAGPRAELWSVCRFEGRRLTEAASFEQEDQALDWAD